MSKTSTKKTTQTCDRINFLIKSINKIESSAKEIFDFAEKYQDRIFTFSGETGAGKTTLIKALCKHLGSEDHTSSPTFSIVNEYRYNKEGIIYHFDLYRIRDQNEITDIGFEEYIYSGHYCFIEWPEKISENILPQRYINIKLSIDQNKYRVVTAKRKNNLFDRVSAIY